jgi:hypothetical protein
VQASRRPATWRHLGDGDVGLWVAYDDRLHAKAIPTARWDQHLKCWRVRRAFQHEAQHLVELLNERNGITHAAAPATGIVAITDAFVALFKVLPADLRRPTHRALARALHPDMGGDVEVMKALNRAMERCS